MAESVNLQVIAPTVPAGSCLNPELTQLIGKTQVLFPAEFSLSIRNPNEPTVEQRDYVWFKTDPITNEIVGTFTWSGVYGLWIQPHFGTGGVPLNERRIYIGSLTSLDTYDGGETGTATETRGPFWIADTNFQNRFPVGVGSYAGTVDTDAGDAPSLTSAPGNPDGRGVYFIKPSGRIYDRSS
jgi:hypothetical protein